jgi:predicted nucleic acid-binding protein
LAPARSKTAVPDTLVAWLERNAERLFVSAITAIEVETGVIQLRRTAPGRRAEELGGWFERILAIYGERVLPLDLKVARVASALADRGTARGRHPGLPDVLIAATCVAHELVLLSRNRRHFEPLGIDVVDPFKRLPS